MPDKPVTVAAYAAGASLAAITLFYVFGPTFFIDGENSYNTSSGRKKGIVGLSNPANDCFINAVLQDLAGLGDLRLYLIRELHRRKLDGRDIYEALPPKDELKKGEKAERIKELQLGPVTKALKEMLDSLNERPIYKKTVSARGFIEALEVAFRTRISRNQQDAQEFLQVVSERLCDEYHAAVKARRRGAAQMIKPTEVEVDDDALLVQPVGGERRSLQDSDITVRIEDDPSNTETSTAEAKNIGDNDSAYGFPLEGQLESQIECQFCQFQYKPNPTSFVTLTLPVPQRSYATLSSCFDGLLKTEYIEDFKCDKCRLQHAVEVKMKAQARAKSEEEKGEIQENIDLLNEALSTNPEKAPERVELPESKHAPKRKIGRHMRITVFPKIIAIHLSRSIYDPRSSSTKNAAKVSFPERLPLGGILDQKWYKLLGIVCHKGSHNSGHYESFRRNHLYPPFSTPDVFRSYVAQSRPGSVDASANPSPRLAAMRKQPDTSPSPLSITPSTVETSPSVSSSSLSSPSTRPSSGSLVGQQQGPAPTSAPRSSFQSNNTKSAETSLSKTGSSPSKPRTISEASRFRRKKKSNDRWWRISDDKIKECKTSDVLGMQKEVYLLFYELERPGDDAI